MAARKKTGSRVELRANMNRALASSEQTTAALVDALAIIEGDSAAALVEAVKALRTIASTSPSPLASARAAQEQDANHARWFRGLALGALKRMGVKP